MLGLPPEADDESGAEDVEAQATERRVPVSLWSRLWNNLKTNVFPEEISKRLLPNEVIQVEIQLAWYRHFFGRLVWRRILPLSLLTMLMAGMVAVLAVVYRFALTWVLLPPGLLLLLVVPIVLFQNAQAKAQEAGK